MKIEANKMVSVTYDLTVGEGEDKELMERATREVPLKFIMGTGMMLPAFEKGLYGFEVGEKFTMTLTPEEAYGEYIDEHVIDLPKNVFEVDGKFDAEFIAEGNTIPMLDAEGNRLQGSVVSVGEETVTMDFNHPLAGETLHFEGEVIDVHEPTVEEIAAMQEASSGCCGCGDDHDCGCGDSHHGHGCGGGCCC